MANTSPLTRTHTQALLYIHPCLLTQTSACTRTCPPSHTSSPSLSQTNSQMQHTHSPTYILSAFSHVCTHTHILRASLTPSLLLSLTNTPSAKSVALLKAALTGFVTALHCVLGLPGLGLFPFTSSAAYCGVVISLLSQQLYVEHSSIHSTSVDGELVLF